MLAPIWGKLISACEATQKLKLEERFGAPSMTNGKSLNEIPAHACIIRSMRSF
jgi:hypothetical protein